MTFSHTLGNGGSKMTPEQHRDWVKSLSQAQIDHAWDEYRARVGESEREAAIRDTNHVLELQSSSYELVIDGRRSAK